MEKQDDEIYCPECGKPIKKNAVICVNCGIQVKEVKTSPVKENADNPPEKNKSVAIVLAIFLNFWSWLYTYKKDFKKFWIYLGSSIVLIPVLIVAYMAMLTDSNITQQLQPTGFGWGLWVFATWSVFFANLSAFIWALCNSIIRPESFYKNYPNG